MSLGSTQPFKYGQVQGTQGFWGPADLEKFSKNKALDLHSSNAFQLPLWAIQMLPGLLAQRG